MIKKITKKNDGEIQTIEDKVEILRLKINEIIEEVNDGK